MGALIDNPSATPVGLFGIGTIEGEAWYAAKGKVVNVTEGCTFTAEVPAGSVDPERSFSVALVPTRVCVGNENGHINFRKHDTSSFVGPYLVTDVKDLGQSVHYMIPPAGYDPAADHLGYEVTAYKLPTEGYQLGEKIVFTAAGCRRQDVAPKIDKNRTISAEDFLKYTVTIPPEAVQKVLQVGSKIRVVEGMPINKPNSDDGWNPAKATAQDIGTYAIAASQEWMVPASNTEATEQSFRIRTHLAMRFGEESKGSKLIVLAIRVAQAPAQRQFATIYPEDIPFAE